MAEGSHKREEREQIDDEARAPKLPPLAPDAFVVMPLPDDFDFETAFKSERELSEEASPRPAEAEPAPIASLTPAPSHVSISIADLIEQHVHLEWHEAVAIAQRLCAALSRHSDAAVQRPLIEPWSVEITDRGELKVRPGATGGDPIVKQVGRVLSALLQESIAPAELRLVAAQASFEVPFYASVDELSAALNRFQSSSHTDLVRSAFRRTLDNKFAEHPPRPQAASSAPPPPRTPESWLPKPVPPTPRARRAGKPSAAARITVLAAAGAVSLAATMWLRSELASPPPTMPSSPPADTVIAAGDRRPQPAIVPQPSAPIPPTRPAQSPPLAAETDVVPTRAAPRAPVAVAPPARRDAGQPRNDRPSVRADRAAVVKAPAAVFPSWRPTAVSGELRASARASSGANPLDAAERRASALLAAGNSADAAIVFDSIVMRDPAHRLDPARSTPEAADALRRSKQALLPPLARSHYQAGRDALDAGDFSLAIAEATRALAMLNDADVREGDGDLKAAVRDLLSTASAAQTAGDEKVYTVEDGEVSPPRPLGRQLPATAPAGTTAANGRLEILVSRAGRVERVTLHTPLNAYQDRMIVSAAKAWRYRPALRNGRPVRFSLILSITLPPSN